MYANIFYFRHINSIGGIETFFYQLAKKYSDLDITIFYNTGDKNQIKRLKQYVRCIKYTGQPIKCDKAFFNFNLDIIDNVEAKEYIQILHGDYKAMGLKPNLHAKITKYVGVSKVVCDSFKEITGIDAEVIYNPIDIIEPKPMLRLISATRLTPDKGKNRMIKLMDILDSYNINYQWLIFTDDRQAIDRKNVLYMKPTLDISTYIKDADYLVQLSNAEGYCYSVVESLLLGTPVIVTDMPVMREVGVEHGKNGYILNFSMNNVPVEDIVYNKPVFTYKAKVDNWSNYLVNKKSTYKEELLMRYKVKALDVYEKRNIKDKDLNRVPKAGEIFEISKDRLDVLLGDNKYNTVFVEVVEELKPVKTETDSKPATKTTKKTTKKK